MSDNKNNDSVHGKSTKVTLRIGDRVFVNTTTKLGIVSGEAVVHLVYNNQYVVVKLENLGTMLTVKKSEVKLVSSVETAPRAVLNQVLPGSKKKFHILWKDGLTSTKASFVPDGKEVFNSDRYFHSKYDTSTFMDLFSTVPYGQVTIEASDRGILSNAVSFFDSIGRHGGQPKGMGVHRVIYSRWDVKGTALVVPVASGIKGLQDFGLHLIQRKPEDKPKGAKYMKRVLAPHEWGIPGTVVYTSTSKQGKVLRIKLKDDSYPVQFDVLHVDIDAMSNKNKALADGVHFISQRLCRLIGLKYGIKAMGNAVVGDGFKGTMLSKLGLGKGFFHVVEMQRFDIIIYGAKQQVKFDQFFLGSMGAIKGGQARTDVQSLGAFINPDTNLWYDLFTNFVDQVKDSIHDESKLRHLTLTSMQPFAERVNKNQEVWVFEQALRYGVPVLKYPGLFRKACSTLLDEVLDGRRGRIPYGNTAHRYNLMPDPNCFNFETGEVDYTQSVVPEGCVSVMDAEQGPFAMYRQPLGNAKEAVVTVNVHHESFKAYIGRDRVIMGPSSDEQLDQMGGGDFDDSVVGTDDVAWIEVIDKAEYPVVRIQAPTAEQLYPLDVNNRHMQSKYSYPRIWTIEDHFDEAASAVVQTMTIGAVDNAVRLDAMLSGHHKANMLKDLKRRIDATSGSIRDGLMYAYVWLDKREDHQLRQVASNLDAFIDYIKMGKGDYATLAPLVDLIGTIMDESVVLPECWSWMGRSNEFGRIPVKRFIAQDYVQAPSLTCAVLKKIIFETDQLEEAFRKEEWMMVDKLIDPLDKLFPRNEATTAMGKHLRDMWYSSWQMYGSGEIYQDPALTDKERGRSFISKLLKGGRVQLEKSNPDDSAEKAEYMDIEGIRPYLNQIDPIDELWDGGIRMSVAVAIARSTYRHRYDETQVPRNPDGTRRSFSDGLLWTGPIGTFFLEAMKEAGLTGLYVPVKFDRASRKFANDKMTVTVYKGDVIRKSTGYQIGHVVDDVIPENGDYMMDAGLICVIEPALALTQSSTEVDINFENPVQFGDDLEESSAF